MKDVILQLDSVSKSFDGKQILNHLDLEIGRNEFITLLGPSGCGKSTTLRIIGGFEKPDEGRVLFEGKDITGLSPDKRNVNTVFQKYSLFPHMDVAENIAFGLKLKKKTQQYIKDKIRYALKLVNMDGYETRKPDSLSGGQQQRVAIARALVGNGEIIVMDEPITNLDAKLREQMLTEIREIQRRSGTTVLYITHDQQSALQLCDRMAIMEPGGNLCQLGTDEDIILHPANRFTFEFIGVSNFIPVEVKGGAITLKPGSRDFPWAEGRLPEGADATKPLEVGVRPNDIVFDKDSPLRVTVNRSVFLGSEYDYFVDLGGRELRVQQNTLDAAKYGVVKEGAETGIRLLNYRFYPPKEVQA